MSSSMINIDQHDPVVKLAMRPIRGILKTSKSIDEHNSFIGMTRSESQSQKMPHFNEKINLIATSSSAEKDSEQTTGTVTSIDEQMDVEDRDVRLNESSSLHHHRFLRRSSVDSSTIKSEHRKQDYNEFEIVRLRRKEIEAELRALEEEESSQEPTKFISQ